MDTKTYKAISALADWTMSTYEDATGRIDASLANLSYVNGLLRACAIVSGELGGNVEEWEARINTISGLIGSRERAK